MTRPRSGPHAPSVKPYKKGFNLPTGRKSVERFLDMINLQRLLSDRRIHDLGRTPGRWNDD